ncbi:MAG: protein translocase subunit SecF [Anaerolineales bacterium]
MLNILGKRYLFFGISTLVILPGLLILLIFGIPVSIDFTGGSLIEVSFASGNPPAPAEMIALYNELGIEDVQVQTTGRNTLIARSSFLDDGIRASLESKMETEFGDSITVERFDTVGPTIGREVTTRGALAVAVASLMVVIYIAFSFRGVENAWRYGVCAILAMLHDLALIFSITAIGSVLWGWQVDSLFLTALLTIIGFSMQDTIVVFDRVRENAAIYKRLPFETLVNHSIVQTLQRSINTQLMTVEFMLLALALFGGITLQQFALVLLIGLFSGTYSSIFIAAPILVVWENKEWKNWFKRKPAEAI